jgi:hypothetical protein
MQELSDSLTRWISHGSLEQFKAEIDGPLQRGGYDSEVRGDRLVIFRPRREGGFLGIGAKTIKDPLLVISREEGSAQLLDEPFDEELARYIADTLGQH